jgi:hypothetical protein
MYNDMTSITCILSLHLLRLNSHRTLLLPLDPLLLLNDRLHMNIKARRKRTALSDPRSVVVEDEGRGGDEDGDTADQGAGSSDTEGREHLRGEPEGYRQRVRGRREW